MNKTLLSITFQFDFALPLSLLSSMDHVFSGNQVD